MNKWSRITLSALIIFQWTASPVEVSAQETTRQTRQVKFREFSEIGNEELQALSSDETPKNFIANNQIIARDGDIRGTAEGEFQLLTKTGGLLWKEPYSYSVDGPAPKYLVSVSGIVCKVRADAGTVTFYSQHGGHLGQHVVVPDFSRTLSGQWSSEGRYFAVTSLDAQERGHYQLLLFDEDGKQLWRHQLQTKFAHEITFSPLSQWVLIGYNDLVLRKFGASVFSTRDGALISDFHSVDPNNTIFSEDGEMVLVINSQDHLLSLYETASSKKLFESKLSRPIQNVKVFSKNNLIYFLAGEKTMAPSPQNPAYQRPQLTELELTVLDLNGTILGAIELPSSFETSPNALKIHPLSSARKIILAVGDKFFACDLDY